MKGLLTHVPLNYLSKSQSLIDTSPPNLKPNCSSLSTLSENNLEVNKNIIKHSRMLPTEKSNASTITKIILIAFLIYLNKISKNKFFKEN